MKHIFKKYYLILLISIFISSCGTKKNAIENNTTIENSVGEFSDSGKSKKQKRRDRKNKIENNKKEYQYQDADADGVPDFIDEEEEIIESSPMIIVSESIMFDNVIRQNITKEKLNTQPSKIEVIDKTVLEKKEEINQNNSTGTIAYSVPKEMQVGKSYQIKLRITKEKGKEINKMLIVGGDREIPISDVQIDSKVTIENIRVENTMTAELISQNDIFTITPLNTNKQIIEKESYTEWGWIVSPQKSGKTFLKLIIKIKIENNGELNYKDIVVFDKNIEVKSNFSHGVKSWISQYWQWLLSTIIIPIIIFFYKRREKNKQ